MWPSVPGPRPTLELFPHAKICVPTTPKQKGNTRVLSTTRLLASSGVVASPEQRGKGQSGLARSGASFVYVECAQTSCYIFMPTWFTTRVATW